MVFLRSMQKYGSTLLITLFITSVVWGAAAPKEGRTLPRPTHEWRANEHLQKRYFLQTEAGDNPRIFQDLDVENYSMQLAFDIDASTLAAQVSIKGAVLDEPLDEIIVDFYDDVSILSLKFNGEVFENYERKDNKVYLDLRSAPLSPEESFVITFDYLFNLTSSFGHGIVLRDQNNNPALSDKDGNSIFAVCSAGQPYTNSAWWPSFDYPSDKATFDIYITCPDDLIAVSNGVLQAEPQDNSDGTKTFFWKESHPMYTSAFAVAISAYETWSDTYVSPLDGTVMPLYFYAFPADAAKARRDYTDYTLAAFQIFPGLFGEYPYIDEKYGVLESPFTMGSLEHQTITHLTLRATQAESNWAVIVHELAHQWWGDWVTCRNWQHVWLHEGFATYAEVLFNEYYSAESPGQFLAENYDDGLYDGILAGTPYAEDIANPWDENKAIYEKGGWVVHMLRNILGDDDFFTALKTYGRQYADSSATTDDLRSVMEDVYGASLKEIFDQWIYTPYRPVYRYEVKTIKGPRGKYLLDILLYQTHAHMINDVSGRELRDYYVMPVEIAVKLINGDEKIFRVYNNYRKQRFQIEVQSEPEAVEIDRDIKILKVLETPILDKGPNSLPTARAFVFPRTVAVNGPVLLFGRANDTDGSIERYIWVIDNKKMQEGKFQMVTFQEPGQHQVLLTVEDNRGDAGSAVPVTITVQ